LDLPAESAQRKSRSVLSGSRTRRISIGMSPLHRTWMMKAMLLAMAISRSGTII